MAEKDKQKTAFSTLYGHYESNAVWTKEYASNIPATDEFYLNGNART